MDDWPWLTLAALGAVHGLNPAMGWLFATAIGLQEGSRRALLRSLVPIAIGHEAAVAVAVAVVLGSGSLVSQRALGLAGAGLLLGFGTWKLLARRAHPRWVGMRLSGRELAGWSFLMSSAHGAGLMLIPAVIGVHEAAGAGHALELVSLHGIETIFTEGVVAAAVHTLAMVTVAGTIAVAVFETIGVGFLRRGWINLDRLWAVALIGAGFVTLFS